MKPGSAAAPNLNHLLVHWLGSQYSIVDPSTNTAAGDTTAVSAPKEEPVYASGYYLTHKAWA